MTGAGRARPSPRPSSPWADPPCVRRQNPAERARHGSPGSNAAASRRIMPRPPRRQLGRAQPSRCAARPTPVARSAPRPRRPAHVDRRSGACRAKTSRCAAGRSRRFPPAAVQVERRQPAGRVRPSASGSSGTSRCGITLVNHEPGPSDHPVAPRGRRPRPPGRPAVSGGSSVHGRDLRGSSATATWPRTAVISAGGRVVAARPRPRSRAGRRTWAAPGRARRAAGRPSPGPRPGRRAAPTGDDQQVADRVSVQVAVAGSGAGSPRSRSCPSRRRRRARPAPCAGRRAAATPNSLAQPAAGAAVVGDGDDGGEVGR